MPIISRFLGVVIAMYFNGHNPPHFHAKYGSLEAEIQINTGAISGFLPPRVLSLVQEWRNLHIQELLDDWEKCQRHQEVSEIEPLE